jgi:hypothetical protein
VKYFSISSLGAILLCKGRENLSKLDKGVLINRKERTRGINYEFSRQEKPISHKTPTKPIIKQEKLNKFPLKRCSKISINLLTKKTCKLILFPFNSIFNGQKNSYRTA